MVKDLTVGKSEEVLWKFPIPMFINVIFQQVYNIADGVIVRKFVGEDALAMVGASYPIIMVFMAVAAGSNIGCSVVTFQVFGEKQYRKVKTAVYTTLIPSVVLSLVLTMVGFLDTNWLMRMTQMPGNIFDGGALYLRICIGRLLSLFLYNIRTGIFQSLGDSRTSLCFFTHSPVGNVILDWTFVTEFGQGVTGMAWATLLAQGVSCVLAPLMLMVRLCGIEADGPIPRFEWEVLGHVSRITVPSILQQSFISIGNILIQGLVSRYGSSVITGYSVAVKLNTLTVTSLTTLADGLSSSTAQNISAGQIEWVRKGLRAGVQMALGVALPFFLLFLFLGNTTIFMFVKGGGTAVADIDAMSLKVVSPLYFVISLKLMADGVLRGAGDTVHFTIATFTDLILRMILAYVLASFMETLDIWVSWLIGRVMATVLSMRSYLSGKWNPLKE